MRNISVAILLVASLPFVLYAFTPFLRLIYRILGKKYIFEVLGFDAIKMSPTPRNEWGIFNISIQLYSKVGLNANYTYRAIDCDVPVIALRVGSEIEVFAIPWLTARFGWKPHTAYVAGGTFIDSLLLYVTALFFPGLLFASCSYYLISENNFVFDVVKLFVR